MGAVKWLDLHFLLSGDFSGLSVLVEGAEPSLKMEKRVPGPHVWRSVQSEPVRL